MSDLLAAAEKALQSAALDPGGTRTLSRSVLETAVPERAWEVVSTAERALGVAAMTLSEIDEAIVHLRAAVLAGRRAGCSRRVGEARMSLASALVLRGQAGRAAREIEAATRDLSASRQHVPTSSAPRSSRSWARTTTRSRSFVGLCRPCAAQVTPSGLPGDCRTAVSSMSVGERSERPRLTSSRREASASSMASSSPPAMPSRISVS